MGEDSEEVTYTIGDIERHWIKYKSEKAMRILKGGKWYLFYPIDAIGKIEGTRAESIKLSQSVSFPDYLKKYAG
jgi:hypothetical protein